MISRRGITAMKNIRKYLIVVIVYDGGDEETGDQGGAFGDEGIQVCFW